MKRLILLMICVSLCLCCVVNAQAASSASLTLSASAASGYGGDEITLSIRMTASAMGGLQTDLTWNTGYLTYVEGSAAFAEGFSSSAMIAQVNVQANCLRLLYANTDGYTASDEVFFTARFRLTEGVNGTTSFTLSNTKMTDAAASVNAMSVSTQGTSVYTKVFDPGIARINLSCSDRWPVLGDTVTVQLSLSSSGPAIGSVQGIIEYDPSVLELEEDSAAFTDAAETAAFTKSLNTAVDGKIQFVYATMDGCPSALMEMRFKVVGGVGSNTVISLTNAKATNAETAHLEQMKCTLGSLRLYPQAASGQVTYTLTTAPGVSCADEALTLALTAQGQIFGGFQGTLTYDASQMEYVSGSAAFADGFAQSADVKLINDSKSGQIQLVYANADGYTPDGSAIFIVQFQLLEEFDLTPVTLTSLKTTNAGSTDVQEIDSAFVQDVEWSTGLHSIVEDAAVAATCTTAGKTAGKHCSACNKVLTAQSTIPAKGHSWDAGTVARKPTTTTEGVLTYTCTACKTTRTEKIPLRVPGDANADGEVDLNDALLVLDYGAGKNVVINLYNADVNQDGKVNAQDVLLIMQYISGWDVRLL